MSSSAAQLDDLKRAALTEMLSGRSGRIVELSGEKMLHFTSGRVPLDEDLVRIEDVHSDIIRPAVVEESSFFQRWCLLL
jgi:hypothetical protein